MGKELITLSSGETQKVTDLSLDDNGFHFIVGTQSLSVPSGEVQDVAFHQQDEPSRIEEQETGDLSEMMKKGDALLEKYPDCQYGIIDEESVFVYHPDGTNLNRYRVVKVLAKEEALGEAEISLGFEPNRQRIRVIHARSYSSDGETARVTPDQIKVSRPDSGEEYFDQEQQMSFTIPKAAVGGLIDYCYEIDEYNPVDKKLFSAVSLFQSGEPVLESRLQVRMPENVPLYILSRNCAASQGKPVVRNVGKEKVYEWKFADLKPVISEPKSPPLRDISPMVVFTLQKDWSYLFQRLKPMYEKRLALSDTVKNKVEELIAGAKTIEEKISRLYLFCQKEIRYISIKGGLASNQVGHSSDETLKNRYGDCTDKGMLFSTMLRHIGVDAYPVGVRTNDAGKAVREVGMFDSNHCITELRYQGKRTYLDCTATDYRYPYFRNDDHDTVTENALTNTLDLIPLPPPEDNALHEKGDLQLEADGTLKVTMVSSYTGTLEADEREGARTLKPEEYEKAIREEISAITAKYRLMSATHSDPLDFSKPFEARREYILETYVPRSGRFFIVEIPGLAIEFPEASLSSRHYDIVNLTTRLYSTVIDLRIPEGLKVKYLPKPVIVKSPYIRYEGRYEQQGAEIKIVQMFARIKRIVPVKDYPSYKRDLERISSFGRERLFLEEIRTPQTKTIVPGRVSEGQRAAEQSTPSEENEAGQ